MSQHYFHTSHRGRDVTVTMGWDRPLGYVFMDVRLNDFDEKQDEAEYLYCNLDDPDFHSHSLALYRDKLDALNLAVPKTMFTEVASDKERNVGNRLVEHFNDKVPKVLHDAT